MLLPPETPDAAPVDPIAPIAEVDEGWPASAEPARKWVANAAAASARSDSVASADCFVCKVAPYSVELPLPAVHRATLAITLGKPAALRQLARDLQRIGQDVEAGLLENYALLLERTNPDRNRVLAEVTRMLRAAVAERRSARRATPAIPWPPTGLPHAGGLAPQDVASSEEEVAGELAARPSSPTGQSSDASRSEAETSRSPASDGVVVLPVVTVAPRRRASR